MQVIKAEVGIVFSRVRIFENSSRGLAAAKKWLTKEANENVTWGCCGGCI